MEKVCLHFEQGSYPSKQEVKVSKALGWKPLKGTHPSVGPYLHSLETQSRTVPATMKRLMLTVPLKNSVVWVKRQRKARCSGHPAA